MHIAQKPHLLVRRPKAQEGPGQQRHAGGKREAVLDKVASHEEASLHVVVFGTCSA